MFIRVAQKKYIWISKARPAFENIGGKKVFGLKKHISIHTKITGTQHLKLTRFVALKAFFIIQFFFQPIFRPIEVRKHNIRNWSDFDHDFCMKIALKTVIRVNFTCHVLMIFCMDRYVLFEPKHLFSTYILFKNQIYFFWASLMFIL